MPAASPLTDVLEFDGITRRYGAVVALDGVSFSVPAGQMFGFLGPNGAGKTTAMRTILGLSVPDSGTVRWKGRTIGAKERLRIGYLPEERGLYPKMAVGEQVTYFARLHGLRAADAAACAHRWLDRLGVGAHAKVRLDTLSLGNQQRVQLAAALVHEPDLLILDEPFSGLDPVAVETLGRVLADLASDGAGVLFSSHQLDLVEDLCQSVAIIHLGRLVAAGTVEGLTTHGRTRLDVEVGGQAGADWALRLDGVHVEEVDRGRARLVLGDGVDSQRVLDAARAAGPIRHFGVARRRLSEVFSEAVSP